MFKQSSTLKACVCGHGAWLTDCACSPWTVSRYILRQEHQHMVGCGMYSRYPGIWLVDNPVVFNRRSTYLNDRDGLLGCKLRLSWQMLWHRHEIGNHCVRAPAVGKKRQKNVLSSNSRCDGSTRSAKRKGWGGSPLYLREHHPYDKRVDSVDFVPLWNNQKRARRWEL